MIYIFNARLEEYKTKLETRRTCRTYSQELGDHDAGQRETQT